MKKLFSILVAAAALSACGGFGTVHKETTKNYYTYEGEIEHEVKDAVEEYLGEQVPAFDNDFYYNVFPEAEHLHEVCLQENIAGCVSMGYTVINVLEGYEEDCFFNAHEFMHFGLAHKYKDPDVKHERKEWKDLQKICDKL